MKNTKTNLLHSVIALLLCFSMLLSTTVAWFTDTAKSVGNIITTGELKAQMHWADSLEGSWKDASTGAIFNEQNWEPGKSTMKFVKISNTGDMAFIYQLGIVPNFTPAAGEPNLADVIDVYYGTVGEGFQAPTAFAADMPGMTRAGTLSELMADPDGAARGILLPEEGKGAANKQLPDGVTAETGEVTVCLMLHMQESAGNEYQNADVGGGFSVQLLATQYSYEKDSFGNEFDSEALFPLLELPAVASAPVTPTAENTVPAGGVTISMGKTVSAVIPEGAAVVPGTTELKLTVTEVIESESNVTLGETEVMRSLDIHVEGLAEDNTVPVQVYIARALPTGLNLGNYSFYHVEDGVTYSMTPVDSTAELTAHNQFTYDPATGDVVLNMASFSEVSAVADTENAWNGDEEEGFSGGDGSEEDPYLIANADQLAYLNAQISNETEGANGFASKHYKLISDINFAGTANTTKENVWYPIGYWKQGEGTNSAGEEIWYTGGDVPFSGVFDGNGNTISGIYQNTWVMDGDYDAGYWDAAMGLFGWVENATIKNLTIDSFVSEGEFTPTGCVATYAGGKSTFENIAITNSHPATYNTAVAGVVGLNATSAGTGEEITFRNVTVDESNTISALWGTYDCSAAGIMGMLRGEAKVNFENCHVAAEMDVYNDACANYQYYQYRYCGMYIGSIRQHFEGGSVPDIRNITAKNCTYSIGDWNRYWYCELVANSLASYTYDHQFSRLTEIADISEISDDGGTTFSKVGNFILVEGYTEGDDGLAISGVPGECYHIVKDAEGNLYRHYHDQADPGAEADSIYETATGVTGDSNGYVDGKLLKEDRQRYFIPFNQLFTGYGWGATAVTMNNLKAVCAAQGVENIPEITLKEDGASYEKFQLQDGVTVKAETQYYLKDLFKAIDGRASLIASASVQVFVSDVTGTVSATYAPNAIDWQEGTVTFNGVGNAKVVITDYIRCIPTVLNISINTVDKFEVKLPNYKEYLYRVGNLNAVDLGYLFQQNSTYAGTINSEAVNVEVVDLNGNNITDSVATKNSTAWTSTKLDFADDYTGPVKVTISSNTATAVTLNLEVVEAWNTTTTMNVKDKNVVLLSDCSSAGFTVSNGYFFCGNGFKATISGNGRYSSKTISLGFVTVNTGGILDNLQIICDIFPASYLYTSEMKEENGYYPYALSAVSVQDSSVISNCYIKGARNNIFVGSGNATIKDTVLECGSLSNIHIKSSDAYTVTLDNVTTIQYQTTSQYDTSKKVLGFGVVVGDNESPTNASLKLKGDLRQYNWVTSADSSVSNQYASTAITNALKESTYQHTINGANTINTGIAILNAKTIKIDDQRSNKAELPYVLKPITMSGFSGQVSSLSGSAVDGVNKVDGFIRWDAKEDGVIDEQNNYSSVQNGAIAATGIYSEENDNIQLFYSKSDRSYELQVDLDNISGNSHTFSFSKLRFEKNGNPLQYSVVDMDGNIVDKNTVITLNELHKSEYVLEITDNAIYDAYGALSDRTETYTYSFTLNATRTSIDPPKFTNAGTATAIRLVEKSGGDWRPAYTVLTGVSVTYWSASESKVKTVDLSTLYNSGTISSNVWTYTCDDYTLTITGGSVHSDGSTITPVVADNTLYFASTNKAFTTGTTSRSIVLTYVFTDKNASTPWNRTETVKYSDLNEYDYNSFKNDGSLEEPSSSSEPCVTPDTLITLADGTQKRVDTLTGNEKLLVWNLQTGKLDSAPIMFIDSEAEDEFEVIHLHFSDGTEVKVISEHGFWDYDLNRYVYLDRNAADYIGHCFAKQNGSGLKKVRLVDVEIRNEETTAWSPVTAEHLCYFTEGMLSMPGGVGGLFNIFEVDAETMTYDYAAMERDIATYDLFTYEELAAMAPGLSRDMFEAAGGAYLKISIGKGNLTEEELLNMINRYSKHFE